MSLSNSCLYIINQEIKSQYNRIHGLYLPMYFPTQCGLFFLLFINYLHFYDVYTNFLLSLKPTHIFLKHYNLFRGFIPSNVLYCVSVNFSVYMNKILTHCLAKLMSCWQLKPLGIGRETHLCSMARRRDYGTRKPHLSQFFYDWTFFFKNFLIFLWKCVFPHWTPFAVSLSLFY